MKILINGVKKLIDSGHRIALDDFTYFDKREPLIKLAHIKKIDVRANTIDKIREQIGNLDRRKVKLIAEKVETQDEYNQFKKEGFDYFQGFFSRNLLF